MKVCPSSYPEVREAVAAHRRVLAHGAGTKPPLSRANDGTVALDMTALSGVLDYQPAEFVLSVRCGTPVRDVTALLEGEGQYLPFDPPLVEAGSTVGGMVAAGLGGPGRMRYGGLRDFLIGVRFVDGTGTLRMSGGKVVKNAAGFDFSKLMIGSLGRLGVLVECTFKVFPHPPGTITLRAPCADLAEAVQTMCRVGGGAWEVTALDLQPPGTLLIRLAGRPETLEVRARRLAGELGVAAPDLLAGDEEAACWRELRDWEWAAPYPVLAKVPVTPARLLALDGHLETLDAGRRYSLGGNLAWVALHRAEDADRFREILKEQRLSALLVRGELETPILGPMPSPTAYALVKLALDPEERFPA